jgi:hypothetical protein
MRIFGGPELHREAVVEVRLESIVLKGSLFDKYCTAKDELTEQYGPPTVDQVTPTFPMFHWATGDTEVIYFVITAHDGSYKISVAYQKRGWLEDKTKHPGHLGRTDRKNLSPSSQVPPQTAGAFSSRTRGAAWPINPMRRLRSTTWGNPVSSPIIGG